MPRTPLDSPDHASFLEKPAYAVFDAVGDNSLLDVAGELEKTARPRPIDLGYDPRDDARMVERG